MPFNYRDFELNSAGDKDWAEREQVLFKRLIDTALDRVPNGRYEATRNPGPNDDATFGFTPGSLWVYGVDIFVCTNNAAGAAEWDQVNTKTLGASAINTNNSYTYISGVKLSDLLASIDDKIGVLSRTNSSGLLHNFQATAVPLSTDDASKGYERGSMWEYQHKVFVCTDNTTSAARWEAVSLELIQAENVNVPALVNVTGSNLNEVLSSFDRAVAKTKDYFSDFSTHNVDDGSSVPNVIYVGKMDKAGTWVLRRITGSTDITIEYAMQSNNPSVVGGYAAAWNLRNSLNYARLSEI